MRHGPHETPRFGQSVVSRYVRTPKPCSCRDQCAPVVPIRHATADDKPEANQPILRLLLHVGLLPGAETAARAKRARARLARFKVRARLPRCPARSRRLRCYEAHAAGLMVLKGTSRPHLRGSCPEPAPMADPVSRTVT